MTAAQADNPVTEAARSPEVRWIFPGRADTAVAEWFGRFPAGAESREDAYLVHPQLGGLSVKIRGGEALEVKVYRGSPGILKVAGRARGRMESWQKWSFPCGPSSQGGGAPPGWVLVRKRISRFSRAGGQIQARVLGQGEESGCMVELTEVHKHGRAWWTLGFEATGPASLLRRDLEATATLVLAPTLPDGMQLGQPGAPAPAVEELAMLSDPRPSVHRPRNIIIPAEPARRIPGQARRPDQRHPGSHMLAQVLAQHRFIQRLGRRLGPRMGVRINQPRQQPALGHQLRAGDRVGGPPVTGGVQVDNIPAGQCDTPNPDHRHTATLPGACPHDQPRNGATRPDRLPHRRRHS